MPPSIFLTISVIICISLPAFAQQVGVCGHVTDLSNNPLAECNISLLDTSIGQLERQVVQRSETESGGHASIGSS